MSYRKPYFHKSCQGLLIVFSHIAFRPDLAFLQNPNKMRYFSSIVDCTLWVPWKSSTHPESIIPSWPYHYVHATLLCSIIMYQACLSFGFLNFISSWIFLSCGLVRPTPSEGHPCNRSLGAILTCYVALLCSRYKFNVLITFFSLSSKIREQTSRLSEQPHLNHLAHG